MNFTKKFWSMIIIVLYMFSVPLQTLFAQGTVVPRGEDTRKLINPLEKSGINSIPELIKNILEGLIKIFLPILALAIIYCGFLFVSARGNSEKINHAKDTLLYTLIGAAILLGSWAIAELIASTVASLG